MSNIKNAVLDIIHSILIVVLILWAIVFIFVLRESYRTYFTTVPVITSVSELREHIGRRVEIISPDIEPTGVSYTYRRRRSRGVSLFYTTAHLHALTFEDGVVAFRTTSENLNVGETVIVRVRDRANDRVGGALLTRYERRYFGRRGYLLRRSGAVRSFDVRLIVHMAGTVDDPILYISVLALVGLGAGGMLLWVRKKRAPA